MTKIWTFFFLRCRTIILVYFWAPGLHKFIVCFWLLRNFFVFSFSLCYWEKGKSRCFKIVGEEEAIRGGPLVPSRPSAPQEGIAGQTMRVVVGMRDDAEPLVFGVGESSYDHFLDMVRCEFQRSSLKKLSSHCSSSPGHQGWPAPSPPMETGVAIGWRGCAL